jgi:hypothetical protein
VRWRYGDAGDRIPVTVGDVWRVGEHVLACGDLELGAGLDLADRYGPADLAYADPPWTPSLATGFRTKAGLPRQVDFGRLLLAVVEAIDRSGAPVAYIEMGRDYVDRLADILAERGREVDRYAITYYGRHPAWLLRASTTLDDPPRMPGVLDDADTPAWAIEAEGRPALVFDPCIGRGLTAIAAARAGVRVLGLDLNPRRLAVAIDRLARLSGLAPELIDRLQ